MQNIDSYFTIFSTCVPFLLFQDPIWEPALYLVFLSPESPHVCDSHSVLLCFPCPWLCWWMWICSFVDYPSVWVFSRSLWSCVLLQRMLKAIFLPFHSEPCPNTVNCFGCWPGTLQPEVPGMILIMVWRAQAEWGVIWWVHKRGLQALVPPLTPGFNLTVFSEHPDAEVSFSVTSWFLHGYVLNLWCCSSPTCPLLIRPDTWNPTETSVMGPALSPVSLRSSAGWFPSGTKRPGPQR